jgi:hypothetical protein
MCVTGTMLNMTTDERSHCLLQWLVRDGKPLPPIKRMLCGALAGITSTTLTYPLGTSSHHSPPTRIGD